MHYIIRVKMPLYRKPLFLSMFFGVITAILLYPAIIRTDIFNNATQQLTPKNEKDEMTILFVGDMMFDRGVRNTINKKGFDKVFGDSRKLFKEIAKADIVVGNLEGPITSYPSKILLPDGSTTGELNFTFPVGTAKALKEHGFDIVGLANNHTANQGADGLAQTKKYLSEADIQYFGDPSNLSNRSTRTCRNNICIALVGYHQFGFNRQKEVVEEIKVLKQTSDIVIVIPHWGEEYQTTPTSLQTTLARAWIDAGADAVIGHHPHVIQTIETYKNKKIFYSLGNYIFDQYFSFNTTHGLAVSAQITKVTNENSLNFSSTSTSTITYNLFPIRNVGTVMSLPDATTTKKILDAILTI